MLQLLQRAAAKVRSSVVTDIFGAPHNWFVKTDYWLVTSRYTFC